ncbi:MULTISPECIES: phosphoribosylanthranilate isomerase [Pandoraea]|uniref:phosphoribosylanthranilate isomerase n=1 Tax=Pandoraea TaxID=93217 RepID=UPI00197F4397|nr:MULTISPECIES: phosphoribosylanthranilate isomerase [Pandoraea]MBN4664998.1 phosphoribosylanthranilate isomerase [Pandoraea nosoerga]MBN4680741.1 phosphoribosylanthranilate isomerase [Pandoraea nosoerga]
MKSLNTRTRIKICGLSQPADVDHAVALGVDAIGLVFYPPSPRFVDLARAAELARRVPPYVSVVGLFVNATAGEIARTVEAVPLTSLQFHGDETPGQCAALAAAAGHRPYLRAMRIGPETKDSGDLLQFANAYTAAQGLLLDALVEGYGGGGKVFDWSLIPKDIARRAVLSGGLNAHNVADAIRQVTPYAVDVSSGVEASRGVKDPARMTAFVHAVRAADAE